MLKASYFVKIPIQSLLLLAFAMPLQAAISLSVTFGIAYDSSSNPVPDGTLWALVVDDVLATQTMDPNYGFAGFAADESLITDGVADDYFTSGDTFTLGSSIGGGTVFAIGGFNGGDGSTTELLTGLTLGVNGLVEGRNFAFYWFPEATFTGDANDTQTIGNQVGGIHNATSNLEGEPFTSGMIVPGDGKTETVGAGNVTLGGSISDSEFVAVTLIPEPGTALLAALGSLILLRRRREVVA